MKQTRLMRWINKQKLSDKLEILDFLEKQNLGPVIEPVPTIRLTRLAELASRDQNREFVILEKAQRDLRQKRYNKKHPDKKRVTVVLSTSARESLDEKTKRSNQTQSAVIENLLISTDHYFSELEKQHLAQLKTMKDEHDAEIKFLKAKLEKEKSKNQNVIAKRLSSVKKEELSKIQKQLDAIQAKIDAFTPPTETPVTDKAPAEESPDTNQPSPETGSDDIS